MHDYTVVKPVKMTDNIDENMPSLALLDNNAYTQKNSILQVVEIDAFTSTPIFPFDTFFLATIAALANVQVLERQRFLRSVSNRRRFAYGRR